MKWQQHNTESYYLVSEENDYLGTIQFVFAAWVTYFWSESWYYLRTFNDLSEAKLYLEEGLS